MTGRPVSARSSRTLVEKLEGYLVRFDQPRLKRENAIRCLAVKSIYDEGSTEVDESAVISEGDENGAYVMTWTWLDFEGTKFDKEKL